MPDKKSPHKPLEEPKAKKRPGLPGDLAQEALLARMLRVNHAGEYGARRIYEGQLAVLKFHPHAPLIRHMWEQEARHLAYFEELLPKHRVRPTLLQPLWHVAGFALGAATAALGEKAAMAATVAVEEVIDGHYARQIAALDDQGAEAPLREKLSEFRAEELEHRDTGLAHGAEGAPGYLPLTLAVKSASRLAIWLSERL